MGEIVNPLADQDCIYQRYLGCIGVKKSLKSLESNSRADVAKESISRLSTGERAEHFNHIFEDEPDFEFKGTDVILQVTDVHLNVISSKTKKIIMQHYLPNVSFAASSDNEDHVAYVAKDERGRKCFVFQCLTKRQAKDILSEIAHGFELRKQSYNANRKKLNNRDDDEVCPSLTVAAIQLLLEKEIWYHGSYLNRETSEDRLKKNGDFLVRESMIEPGRFVLSVMHDGNKLHLVFDSIAQVRTNNMKFEDISDLVKFHYSGEIPIVADKRVIYLRNGVPKPPPHSKKI